MREGSREPPPCEECFVELMPSNLSIINMYGFLQSQVKENGAPDFNAICNLMSVFEIEDIEKRLTFERLILCFNVSHKVKKEIEDKEEEK